MLVPPCLPVRVASTAPSAPPPPPVIPPPPVQQTIKFTPPKVVKDEEVEEPPPTQEEVKDVQVSTVTQEGDKVVDLPPENPVVDPDENMNSELGKNLVDDLDKFNFI